MGALFRSATSRRLRLMAPRSMHHCLGKRNSLSKAKIRMRVSRVTAIRWLRFVLAWARPTGKARYRARAGIAEFPNANCRNRGLHQFRVRGRLKAKAQTSVARFGVQLHAAKEPWLPGESHEPLATAGLGERKADHQRAQSSIPTIQKPHRSQSCFLKRNPLRQNQTSCCAKNS